MKFILNRDSNWSAHETPFNFVLFPHTTHVDIIWNYAGSTGEAKEADMEAAKNWCHQFMLHKTLNQLRRIAPDGARTAETDTGWEFLCDGYDRDMGYQCTLKPGHSGQCYSDVKRVWFHHQ